MTGCTARRYNQFETSPEAIEQELRPAVCERRQTDRLKANYSIDDEVPHCTFEMDLKTLAEQVRGLVIERDHRTGGIANTD